MKFKVIEHTADIGVEAYGDDLKQTFENAALGFWEIIAERQQSSIYMFTPFLTQSL